MTTDLAARVRQLVEGGVEPITLDEVALRAPEKSTSARRTAVVAATLVLVVVLSVAVVAALDRDASRNAPAKMLSSALPLSEIPEGVSVQQFGYRLAFVVRDGSEYTVFDTNVHHLPGEKALWWCPKEQLFIAPTHAETFSKSGKAIGGPATAALDRYQAAVRRNQLRVDLSQVVPGAKGNAQTPTGQKGGTGVGAWDSGPDSFCEGALKVNNALPTSVLRVEALASGTYREKVYTVPAGLTEIRLGGATGILFTFDDPRYRYCYLATDPGAPHSCRVYLTPGDYLVYDAVPGHRRAGYESTIRVSPPPDPVQPALTLDR